MEANNEQNGVFLDLWLSVDKAIMNTWKWYSDCHCDPMTMLTIAYAFKFELLNFTDTLLFLDLSWVTYITTFPTKEWESNP